MSAFIKQRGFTLTELITIIIIVGILAVMASSSFTGNDAFQQRGSVDQVKSALRLAQKAAVSKHNPVSVVISKGATGCANILAGMVLSCAVAVLDAGAGTYTFNSLGQLTSPVPPVTLTIGGATITIEAETGYVH